MKIITDEFTSLPISRQRRYQLRHERDGLCRLCEVPVLRGHLFCREHVKKQRLWCATTPSLKKNYNPLDLI